MDYGKNESCSVDVLHQVYKMITPIRISQIIDAVLQSGYYDGTRGDSDHSTMIYPSMISYDQDVVKLFNTELLSSNPKALFALCLQQFKEPLPHEAVRYSGHFRAGSGCTIGGPGFGYIQTEHSPIYMPHLGRVIFEEGVYLHNNVNIDRGVIGDTVIGRNTKIDSGVHIAHNVQIGRNCLIVAGAVIGGSCIIGDGAFIGMNASIKQKVKVGNNAIVGAGAVVTKDIPDGETWAGVPAKKIG